MSKIENFERLIEKSEFQYDEKFYKFIEQIKKDEEIIIPLMIRWISPKSIVDFGCGEGTWLEEALHYDCYMDVLGLDGDYVSKERLKILEDKFKAVDLREPISLNKKFDLAISTEVAEHIEEEFVDVYLDNITKASDQILFSAAIPGQGGTHHVNEQWQSYWIERFENRGFYCDYSVRNYFWNEDAISDWRKQNLLFFSKKKQNIAPSKEIRDVVHPREMERMRMEIESKLDFYIFNPVLYTNLDQMIAKLIKQNKKIVIYPYGVNGQLCEKILYLKYGITDYIIADNHISMRGKKIYTVKEFALYCLPD